MHVFATKYRTKTVLPCYLVEVGLGLQGLLSSIFFGGGKRGGNIHARQKLCTKDLIIAYFALILGKYILFARGALHPPDFTGKKGNINWSKLMNTNNN